MIEGAIFDFDGTLFDSMYIWDSIGEDYIKSLGFEPEKNLREKFIKMSLRQAAQYYIDNYALELSPGEIMDGINKLAENYYYNIVKPKPGIKELLGYLSDNGVKMCIATATDDYLIKKALERCGMDGYFKGIFTCNGVGAGKDSPLIYEKALSYLGTDKKRTPVFEDAFHAAMTAKNAGFSLIGIYDIHEKEQDGIKNISDIFIEDTENLSGLYKFIEKL